MACRVGITTNPEERKKDWEKEYPGLKNWTIIARNLSYSDAQAKEDEYARKNGCISRPGGPDNGKNNWVVYKFDY